MSTRPWDHASDSNAPIELVNPARPSERTSHPSSTADDIDRAVDAAHGAQPAWARTTPMQRAQALNRLAAALRSHTDDLAQHMLVELGKPLADGRGEVANAANVFDYYASVLTTRSDQTSSALASADQLATRRFPLGVVAAITPWNFPVNLAAVKLAPALAFGNAVVLKPSPNATATTRAMFDALYESDAVPAGLLGLVHGEGAFAAERLIGHEHISGISFTGSTAVGRRIMALAAERNIPSQCEMGGNNPLLVLADADLDTAVSLTVDGAYRLAGQRCTATSRVIVEDSVYDEFTRRLLVAVEAVRVGDPIDDGVLVGPLVSEASLRSVAEAVDAYVAAGATVHIGGGPASSEPTAGFVYRPTVLELPQDTEAPQEEIFGPVLFLHRVRGLDEAIAAANATPYGLAAAVCTRDIAAAHRVIDEVEAGAVSVNGSTAAWPYQQAFGGWKSSGAGIPELGPGVEQFFTRQKTVRVQWAA